MINENPEQNKMLKINLLDLFKKHGYNFNKNITYDILIKITSGGIAWIDVNAKTTIK